jgi:hypothetical protein
LAHKFCYSNIKCRKLQGAKIIQRDTRNEYKCFGGKPLGSIHSKDQERDDGRRILTCISKKYVLRVQIRLKLLRMGPSDSVGSITTELIS